MDVKKNINLISMYNIYINMEIKISVYKLKYNLYLSITFL